MYAMVLKRDIFYFITVQFKEKIQLITMQAHSCSFFIKYDFKIKYSSRLIKENTVDD